MVNDVKDSNDMYWASHEDPKKTAAIALQKGQSFFNTLSQNAYIEKLYKMWRFYHGVFDNGTGHQVNFGGEQGEFTNLYVNHFRNIARHIITMITANRPVMDARAINTDYKSQAQTILATGILDYYMREKGLEDALQRALEIAVVLGAGFVKMEWNATTGEKYDYDEETGQYTYEGELEFTTLSQLDVVVDGTKEKWSKEWVVVRSFHNRFNLSAKYPEYSEEIKKLQTKFNPALYNTAFFSNDSTDDVPVYELFHGRTEAMPNGRYMLFLSEDIILMDTHLPYREVPIYRISPSDFMGTPYGYSPLFDLYPIQEAINTLHSTILTNQAAFGVQNLFVPKESDINVTSLQGGMNIIEGNTPPVPLQLTQTPQEVFNYLQMLIQEMETISGVSSVTRGQPEASLKSGTALALVQSMSLQFISQIQQSYVYLIENVGTGLINILKDYATTPKMIALVGKNNRPLLKEFTGEEISAISRVVVDMGNPLGKTIAGRVQIAEQMMQMNIIKTPEQYFQVMNTGRLDSMYEGEQSHMLLIRRENEKMLEGINPLVSPTDKHSIHIQEHTTVLDDPDLRENPELAKTVMDHIQQHIEALRNVDPELLQLMGQQASPQNPGLQPPPGATPPQGGEPQGPSSESNAPSQVLEEVQGIPQSGEQVNGMVQSNIPEPAKVDGSLLPNPGLQQAAMGNVK